MVLHSNRAGNMRKQQHQNDPAALERLPGVAVEGVFAARMRCVAPLEAPANGCTGSAGETRGVGADMTTRASPGWLASPPGAASGSDGSELLLRVSDRSGGA